MLIIHYLLFKINKCFTTYGIYSAHKNQSNVCELKTCVSLNEYSLLKYVYVFSKLRKYF